MVNGTTAESSLQASLCVCALGPEPFPQETPIWPALPSFLHYLMTRRQRCNRRSGSAQFRRHAVRAWVLQGGALALRAHYTHTARYFLDQVPLKSPHAHPFQTPLYHPCLRSMPHCRP